MRERRLGRAAIAVQRATGTHHVQMRLGHVLDGERIGRVQQHVFAPQRGVGEQPGGIALERLHALPHVGQFLAGKMRHQADDAEAVGRHQRLRLASSRLGGHLQPIAAHPRRVEGQVHARTATAPAVEAGDRLRRLQSAHQFLDVVGQRGLDLPRRRRAHAHQPTLEAAGARHPRLLGAGDADVGNACADDVGHHHVDADSVRVGLHHGAHFCAAGQHGADQSEVVVEDGRIHLDPGIRCEHARRLPAAEQRRGLRAHGGRQRAARRRGEEPAATGRDKAVVGHVLPRGNGSFSWREKGNETAACRPAAAGRRATQPDDIITRTCTRPSG